MNGSQLLPDVRELCSRHPEAFSLAPYELQSLLWSLRYTDSLADEAEIAAAVEVARGDWPQWGLVA